MWSYFFALLSFHVKNVGYLRLWKGSANGWSNLHVACLGWLAAPPTSSDRCWSYLQTRVMDMENRARSRTLCIVSPALSFLDFRLPIFFLALSLIQVAHKNKHPILRVHVERSISFLCWFYLDFRSSVLLDFSTHNKWRFLHVVLLVPYGFYLVTNPFFYTKPTQDVIQPRKPSWLNGMSLGRVTLVRSQTGQKVFCSAFNSWIGLVAMLVPPPPKNHHHHHPRCHWNKEIF